MYTSDIQGAAGIKTTLNGPQGHVSARTVALVAMMDTGLQRLYANLGKFNYRHTNLLSCMTLDVENCHSTVHHKQGKMSMAEAVKRVTSWAAFYHTSRQSYPKPGGALLLSQVPFMKPLANVDMRPADCNALRDWASSYGAAVRQRTVGQETTTARHGTLPEFMHQRQCEVAEKPILYCF